MAQKLCCCCDMRQGVMVSNALLIGINVCFAFLFIIGAGLGGDDAAKCADFCAGTSEYCTASDGSCTSSEWAELPDACTDNEKLYDYETLHYTGRFTPANSPECDSLVWNASDDVALMQMITQIIFWLLILVSAPTAIVGAMQYNTKYLMVQLIFLPVYIFITVILSLVGVAKTASFGQTIEVVFGLLVLVISMGLYCWLLYADYTLYKMLKDGTMTKENYAAQKKSCCGGSATAVVQPTPTISQASVVQASVVQPTVISATAVQASVVQPTVVQATVVQANVVSCS